MHPNTSRTRLCLAAASIVAASVLAACGSSDGDEANGAAEATTATTDETVGDAMAEKAATTDAMVDETSTTDAMADDAMVDDTMVDEMTLPAWQTIALTDVDGASFTLDDFHGTPVFVETFATWCPNCKKQLEDTNAAAEQPQAA